MPELPEVETTRLGLLPHMQGQHIQNVLLRRDNLRLPFGKDFKAQLNGRDIKTLHRRGKYFWADLGNQNALMMHLGMSGSFRIEDQRMKADEYQKHDHAILSLSNDKQIIYNDPRRFGFMLYIEDVERYEPFLRMGPEPLSNHFSGPVLHTALHKKNTAIKIALLDQSVVSGLGNIYVCEALYITRIDPRRPAKTLSLEECEALSTAIKQVLERAIKAGGSTLKDHQQVDGELGYFQHQFNVYDRAGQPCQACNNPSHLIERIVQGGRSTFFCPKHQK